MLDRAEAAQVLEIIDIDVPVVDLIAALAQQIADHVLARTFGAAGRGNRDKIPGGGELCVETGIDGVKEFTRGIVRVHEPHRDRYENRFRVNTMVRCDYRPAYSVAFPSPCLPYPRRPSKSHASRTLPICASASASWSMTDRARPDRSRKSP